MLRFEVIESFDELQRGILDDVAGVEMAAGIGRQSAVRPPRQSGKTPLEQRLDRGAVASLAPHDELECRLVSLN